MAERDNASNPIDDIADRIRDFIDGVVGALEEVFAPPPEPVRVPVPRYPRRPARRR